MPSPSVVFVGIKGSVLALDRRTGQEAWRAKLKGSGFVNLALDKQHLFATTHGEVFCLDIRSGRLLWNNPLKGMGYGLATLAGESLSAPSTAALAQQMANDQAAAASTTAT